MIALEPHGKLVGQEGECGVKAARGVPWQAW